MAKSTSKRKGRDVEEAGVPRQDAGGSADAYDLAFGIAALAAVALPAIAMILAG